MASFTANAWPRARVTKPRRIVLHCIKYLKYQCGLLELRKLSQFACWPPPVFTVEYLVVFKRWAEQHPKWLSRPAPDTLAAALTEGFPCR